MELKTPAKEWSRLSSGCFFGSVQTRRTVEAVDLLTARPSHGNERRTGSNISHPLMSNNHEQGSVQSCELSDRSLKNLPEIFTGPQQPDCSSLDRTTLGRFSEVFCLNTNVHQNVLIQTQSYTLFVLHCVHVNPLDSPLSSSASAPRQQNKHRLDFCLQKDFLSSWACSF